MPPLSSFPDSYLAGMAAWLLAGGGALIALLKLRRRWRGKPRARRWTGAALSLWMCLATLTLVELGFALFYDQTDSFSKTNVSKRWYALHVRTNAEGFRDEFPLRRKPSPGQKRIVFVGDSFTFGHGVEVDQRFSDRIAAALEEEQPGRFAVSNVSLPGLDARQLVDDLVPKVLNSGARIDVLVYTFVLNDIEYFDERTAEFYQSLAAGDPTWFPFRGTYFFNLLYYRGQQALRPASRDYYGYLKQSYEGPPWERLEKKLDELVELCRSRRVDLRIAIFPFLQNLGPDYPFAEAHRKLAGYCESRGLPCVDLRGPLEQELAEHGGGLTVNRFDAHPNPRCHAAAARTMLQTILRDVE